MDKTSLFKALPAVILLTASTSSSAAVSYFNDFSGPSDGKWSNYTTYTTTESTPNQVLGRFSGTGAANGSNLALDTLAANSVTVEFDLYIFDSWEKHFTGSSPASPGTVDPNWNPDIVQVSANGTAILSLSNEYTKVTITDLLTGNTFNQTASGQFGGSSIYNGGIADKRYHISLAFINTAPTLNLSFTTLSTQAITNESFGIDNLRVTAVPAPSAFILFGIGFASIFNRHHRRKAPAN